MITLFISLLYVRAQLLNGPLNTAPSRSLIRSSAGSTAKFTTTKGLGVGSTTTSIGRNIECCQINENMILDIQKKIDKLNQDIAKEQQVANDLIKRLDVLDQRLDILQKNCLSMLKLSLSQLE